jgi:hypothetical protein
MSLEPPCRKGGVKSSQHKNGGNSPRWDTKERFRDTDWRSKQGRERLGVQQSLRIPPRSGVRTIRSGRQLGLRKASRARSHAQPLPAAAQLRAAGCWRARQAGQPGRCGRAHIAAAREYKHRTACAYTPPPTGGLLSAVLPMTPGSRPRRGRIRPALSADSPFVACLRRRRWARSCFASTGRTAASLNMTSKSTQDASCYEDDAPQIPSACFALISEHCAGFDPCQRMRP